jgi:hypothetical protein
MPKKKSDTSWKHSDAKKHLDRDLIDGTIPLDRDEMEPMVVYQQRPEFAAFPYEKVRGHLNTLRRKNCDFKARADSESASLARDRCAHPKTPHNHIGEPRWEGSAAFTIFAATLTVWNNWRQQWPRVTPMELYETREEYTMFPLEIFRKHIYQENTRGKSNAQRRSAKK